MLVSAFVCYESILGVKEVKAKLSESIAISMFPLLHYLTFLRALKRLVVQLRDKEGSVIIPALHVGSSLEE